MCYTGPDPPCSNFLLKLLQLLLRPVVSMADGDAGVAAGRSAPAQELQWEIHESGAELQVHGIEVPIPSFLPGMPASTPLTALNVKVCMSLKVTDLCVHISKKRAAGETTDHCTHGTAAFNDAQTNVEDAAMAATQAASKKRKAFDGSPPAIPCAPEGDPQIEVGKTVIQTEIGGADTQADGTWDDVTEAETQHR